MNRRGDKSRLLIVHSCEETRTFLRRRFTRLGYDVLEAGAHRDALALAGVDGLELILLDLRTRGETGRDGLDLLRSVRARVSADLPILALAEESPADQAVEALALGADDILMGPLSFDLTRTRVAMLTRGGPPARAASGELQDRLDSLEEAARRTEAVAAGLEHLGHEPTAPINSLLGAARVLTRICATPALKRTIARIDAAADALDVVMVRALGGPDRRRRETKAKLDLLLACGPGDRAALDQLAQGGQVDVAVTHARKGWDLLAALDARFFDLIVVDLAVDGALHAISAVRRSERENGARRTPVVALGAAGDGANAAMAAGADLFAIKPVSAESLMSALSGALVREADDVRAAA